MSKKSIKEYIAEKRRSYAASSKERKHRALDEICDTTGLSRKYVNVLPENRRLKITVGDLEHFDSSITEADVRRVKDWGFDHIRVGFDQIVLEEAPYRYRERTFARLDAFVGWCAKYKLNLVLNLHKAIGNYGRLVNGKADGGDFGKVDFAGTVPLGIVPLGIR